MRPSSPICCRAFALTLCLFFSLRPALADDQAARDRPFLPITQKWSVDLKGPVTEPPLADGSRVFIAYAHELDALSGDDKHELWHQPDGVTCPLAIDGALLLDCRDTAIEGRHTADGTVAWTLDNVKTVAPLIAEAGWLLAVTDKEVLAIRDTDGTVIWRKPVTDVVLPPAIDGNDLYLGARDGQLMGLNLPTGDQRWQPIFVPGGVTALAAAYGRVYAGGGDKKLYAYNGQTREIISGWPWRIGAFVVGHIAIDEDHVYFSSLDNVVRALDRRDGNQRWDHLLNDRTPEGVFTAGHVVIAPTASATLQLIYAKTGGGCGTLTLPGGIPVGASLVSGTPSTSVPITPAILAKDSQLEIFVVTTGLSNTWVLTKFGPDPEPSLEALAELPGLFYLNDPELLAPAEGLWRLLAGDPVLFPLDAVVWPILLPDPPLEPLTELPGIQLRPLSPTLPIRHAAPGPGG